MAYIGNSPESIQNGKRFVYEFTSTAGQTAYSGSDDNGQTLDLLTFNEQSVFLNGVRLISTDDYTVSGDTLTLTSAASLNDFLVVETQAEVGNTFVYTRAESDARYINYNGDIVSGDLQITGEVDTGSLIVDTDVLVVDATNNRVGIGTSSPVSELNVDGRIVVDDGARDNPSGGPSVVIDYQTTSDIQGRIRSRDWDAATWKNFAIEANNINLIPAGNVGIGTTNPSQILEAQTSSTTYVTATTTGTGTSAGHRSTAGTNDWVWFATQGQPNYRLYDYASSAVRLTVTNGGNVGIGTDSPASDAQLSISAPEAPHIYFERSNSARYDSAIGMPSAGDLAFYLGANSATVSGLSERMRITSAGKVGIGTNSPDTRLHVQQSADNTSGGIQVRNSADASGMFLYVNSSNHGQIDMGSAGDLQFRTGSTDRVTIKQTGNVGIGEGSPTEKLLVNGSINSSNQSSNFNTGDHRVMMDIINSTKIARIGTVTGTATPTGTQGEVSFLVNGSEKMRLDADGRVLIGTTTEGGVDADQLTISGDNRVGMTIRSANSGSSRIYFSDGTSGAAEYVGYITYDHLDNHMRFGSGAVETFRIDTNQNLLVGKTSTSINIAGSRLIGGGAGAQFTADGTEALALNRLTNDGDLIWLGKAGTKGGSIGIAQSGDRTYFAGGSYGIASDTSEATIMPCGTTGTGNNGVLDLGKADARWKDLYLSGVAKADTFQFAQNSGASGATEAIYRPTTGQMAFKTNSSLAMTIDSSGNVLVGKTSDNNALEGISLARTGAVKATNSNDLTGIFNRLTTDGDIVQFAKDGSPVGSIGSYYGSLMIGRYSGATIAFSSTGIYSSNDSGTTEDASYSLGTSGSRFTDLYLSGGVYLGGTGSANKLDDYEEGTWTPSLKGATGDGGTTTYGSTPTGLYTKIGNLVTVTCVIYNTAHTGSGAAHVFGLPFACSSSGEAVGTYQVNTHSTAYASGVTQVAAIIQGSNSHIHFRGYYTGTSTGPHYIPMQNFTYLRATITYPTNA